MNVERIYVRKGYLVLNKISELSGQYVCIDIPLDAQKINTGDSIKAMIVKNVEQLKGTRPFSVKSETEIMDDVILYGTRQNDDAFKIAMGDLVKFNLNKYTVIGIVVNNYAQWNIPTPFMFSTFDLVGDYKALFNSRFSDEEINSKINDNFQAGKYDNQMTIPLVNVDKNNPEITVIDRTPSDDEVQILIGKYNYKQSVVLTPKENVFIDTVMRSNSTQIDSLRAENPELYKGMQDMLLSVNNAINAKISGTKTEKIPVQEAQKEVEPTSEIPLFSKERLAELTNEKLVNEFVFFIVDKQLFIDPQIINEFSDYDTQYRTDFVNEETGLVVSFLVDKDLKKVYPYSQDSFDFLVANGFSAPKEQSEEDLSFLDDIDGVLDLSFLDDIDNLV
jgi:hypothetical protein